MSRNLRFDRAAARLHALPVRVLAELLAEIEAPVATVERFANLDAGMLRAVGGDRFPPHPLYLIDGGVG